MPRKTIPTLPPTIPATRADAIRRALQDVGWRSNDFEAFSVAVEWALDQAATHPLGEPPRAAAPSYRLACHLHLACAALQLQGAEEAAAELRNGLRETLEEAWAWIAYGRPTPPSSGHDEAADGGWGDGE